MASQVSEERHQLTSGVECKTVQGATGSSEENRRKLAITEGAHRAQPGARDF
jgi:hypothetical protein